MKIQICKAIQNIREIVDCNNTIFYLFFHFSGNNARENSKIRSRILSEVLARFRAEEFLDYGECCEMKRRKENCTHDLGSPCGRVVVFGRLFRHVHVAVRHAKGPDHFLGVPVLP